MAFDVLLRGGLVFDGTGAPGRVADLAIRDGRVAALGEGLDARGCAKVVDARGCWVMPGFLDVHTHYDAELLAAPALSESVRHGVTTVTVGSCSIGTVLADPEDCSDMFTRVEAIPRRDVLPLLRATKTWDSPRAYAAFLARHSLGPNVTAFLGHSDLRARAMGLARAVDPRVRPSEGELAAMETWLEEALDAGFLGLSTMTNPWDKLDGERHRSAQLPSTYARWREYRRLHAVLRRRGRVLQSAPNIVTKGNALLFALESAGFRLRRPLKTTLLTLADVKASPLLHRVVGPLTRALNALLGGDLRWQTLPVPFEVYADGIDLVVFEEFLAGQRVLDLVEEADRRRLMQDPAYRASFRRDYDRRFSPRVWQRDFHDAFVVACPEPGVAGRSFGEIAAARGVHPVDAFLDLVVAHGPRLRWRTVIANHRPAEVARMLREPASIVGFADSGAHVRNMAFYNFPLRALQLVRDAARTGAPVMPLERAVWRLTGELAAWLDVDAGRIREGDRADVVVVDPEGLDARLGAYEEAPMEAFGGLLRMVNRSDAAVRCVTIRGRVAFEGGVVAPELGRSATFGRFLPAGGEAPPARAPSAEAPATRPRPAARTGAEA